MPRKPFFPAVNSAAITAPSANPARLLASCLILIVSTSDSYVISWIPGTSPSRDGVDRQVGRARRSLRSSGLYDRCFPKDTFGQRDSRSTGCVQLVDMVDFRHFNVVGGEVVHDFRQILVHGEEDIYADAEVGGVEEGFALFLAFLLDLADTVQPSGSTRYDRHAYPKHFI